MQAMQKSLVDPFFSDPSMGRVPAVRDPADDERTKETVVLAGDSLDTVRRKLCAIVDFEEEDRIRVVDHV
jgi:hypothetical protein